MRTTEPMSQITRKMSAFARITYLSAARIGGARTAIGIGEDQIAGMTLVNTKRSRIITCTVVVESVLASLHEKTPVACSVKKAKISGAKINLLFIRLPPSDFLSFFLLFYVSRSQMPALAICHAPVPALHHLPTLRRSARAVNIPRKQPTHPNRFNSTARRPADTAISPTSPRMRTAELKKMTLARLCQLPPRSEEFHLVVGARFGALHRAGAARYL